MVDLHQGHEISEAVDVWALGCILYTLAFHKHPFDAGTELQIINASVTFPPTSPYSPEVESIIRFALVPDPAKRPTVFQLIERVAQRRAQCRGHEADDTEAHEWHGENVALGRHSLRVSHAAAFHARHVGPGGSDAPFAEQGRADAVNQAPRKLSWCAVCLEPAGSCARLTRPSRPLRRDAFPEGSAPFAGGGVSQHQPEPNLLGTPPLGPVSGAGQPAAGQNPPVAAMPFEAKRPTNTSAGAEELFADFSAMNVAPSQPSVGGPSDLLTAFPVPALAGNGEQHVGRPVPVAHNGAPARTAGALGGGALDDFADFEAANAPSGPMQQQGVSAPPVHHTQSAGSTGSLI